jgi:hypothetical protein
MAGAPLRPDAWGFKGSTYTDTKTGHAPGQDGERKGTREKKASGDRRIVVRRCARVIADIDGHRLAVSNRSLQRTRQTGGL